MAHNGCMLMRGDSGSCVEVVTKTVFRLWEEFGGTINSKGLEGCCAVFKDENGELIYEDEYNWEEVCGNPKNELISVFKDGKLIISQTLAGIRAVLHEGAF